MVTRYRCVVAAGALVLAAGALGCRSVAQTQPRTEMVPMRDGVRLATDIHLPEGKGPWPAILTRTPYGKGPRAQELAGVVRQGVAVVIQDLRGRFDSEGESSVFLTDGWGALQDGYDTVEWVAAQPWSNGKVGMAGGSAMGITQYLAAGAAPPHLMCCDVAVATSSLYHYAAYPGGAFGQALVGDWLRQSGFPDAVLQLVREHPSCDAVWRTANLAEVAPHVTVPMCHLGGWYDVFQQGTIDAFTLLQHQGGKGARGNQRLVVGPWGHGGQPTGELHFPPNAAEHPRDPARAEWFAYWLLGRPSDVMTRTPAVQYYTMGACGEEGAPGNEWRSADDWPVPSTEIPYYLRASGELTRAAPAADGGSRRYLYDPADPVPTRGGCNLTIPAGPLDQREIEGRGDTLLFTSEPLAAPLEVTGRLTARLWVSSSAPDTDFTAKLTDVYPDGRSMLVCDGIRRARYRESYAKPRLMEPGKVYQVEVDLWSTSIVLNAGHRIRLAVSSSNAPRFEPNPNTAGGPGSGEAPQAAENTVYMDAERPSCVLLPVVGEKADSALRGR